jgi:hypothetical protein
MPKLAIIIAASATPSFYSQIAAIKIALSKMNWHRWQPKIYAYLGEHDADSGELLERWRPYLSDVELFRVSDDEYHKDGNWAQCDAAIRHAPRDADVVLALDADTLPVAPFEELLDRVVEADCIAGVMAHTPFPPVDSPQARWRALASELIDKPLDFSFAHSLVPAEESPAIRMAPFYLNGGFVLHSRAAFNAFAPTYMELRHQLMERLEFSDFSAQAAMTLAIAQEGIRTLELPMRYNFPNDPRAERLQSSEMDRIVIHHYQHRGYFDRHQIFKGADAYEQFIALPLSGINKMFQSAVKDILGQDYPFPQSPCTAQRPGR